MTQEEAFELLEEMLERVVSYRHAMPELAGRVASLNSNLGKTKWKPAGKTGIEKSFYVLNEAYALFRDLHDEIVDIQTFIEED